MSHVSDALSKFFCGPGEHNAVNTGIFFSEAAVVTPGRRIPDADQPLWVCSECGIDGGFMTCMICGGSNEVTRQTVVNLGADRRASGELCMDCYLGLMGIGVAGWTLG